MKTTALSCVIAILALGCSERAQPPLPGMAVAPAPPLPPAVAAPIPLPAQAPVPAARPPFSWEPTISSAGGACTVGQAVSLGGKEGRLQSLEIGFGPEGGLIAWPMDDGHAQLIPINGDGTVTEVGSVVGITSASGLNEILALGGSFMLSTHAVCPDKKFFFKCLHHRLLGDRGQPLGPEGTTVTKEWIGAQRTVRRSDAEIVRLWSFMYIPPRVETFVGSGAALNVTTVAEPKGLGEVVRAEAFAADGAGWAAVFADEANDSAHVLVTSAGAATPMRWLPGEGRALALRRDGDGFALLYATGEDPERTGRVARLTAGGQRAGEPAPLVGRAPIPGPFSDDLAVSLELKRTTLVMNRTDAAGRRIGDPIEVGVGLRGDRDPAPYGAAWSGDRCVVAYGTVEGGQWKLYAVPVTCSGLAH